MSSIEQKISLFLENVCDGNAAVSEELIQEFGERCKNILRESFVEKKAADKKFSLRMSNIGRPLRQLMLAKSSGSSYRPSKEFKLKATVGHIYEAFMLALMKSAGVNIEDQDKQVVLDVEGTPIYGTYDVKIDGVVYDIKTASPYSYEHKFTSFEVVQKDDPFGYIAQGFGYGLASGSPFGGWIVINKATGEFKVIEVPKEEYEKLKDSQYAAICQTVDHVNTDKPIPPCTGVIDEHFFKRATGNKILNPQCSFCDHKFKCHPDLQALPDVNSTAKTRKIKYYVSTSGRDAKED